MILSPRSVFIFFLGIFGSAAFAGPGLDIIRRKMLFDGETALGPGPSFLSETFEQNLDHKGAKTFTQRYFISKTYSNGASSPVLFFICGEGACSFPRGAIESHAMALGATIVALEHRYYGQSIPFAKLDKQNLKYLSTEMALEDLAAFQIWATKNLQLEGKWITIGGSYPGSLSAYYRLKYPQLVAGALASSGPVRAKENFEEYDAHVNDVAGPECAGGMREVVKELERSRLQDRPKFMEYKAGFSASDIKDDIDFLYVVADVGAAAVQYGFKDRFCQSLKEAKTPMAGYQSMAKTVYNIFGLDAVKMSMQGAESENASEYQGDIGTRQWLYQSCTEYGYWQNAFHDPTRSTRSSLISAEYSANVCNRLFGISGLHNEAAMNKVYYLPLNDKTTSHIFYTNGVEDPWSKLSITPEVPTNADIERVIMKGAAHCYDLGRGVSDDVLNAQKKFVDLAKAWIE